MRLSMPARVLLVLGAVSALEQAVAWACSCLQVTDYVEAAADYDQVFVGEVTRAGGTGCGYQTSTRFEVQEAFKGVEEGDKVVIEHDTRGASCGLLFDEGETYLVYAWDGRTNLCAPGGLAHEHAGAIDDLRLALAD